MNKLPLLFGFLIVAFLIAQVSATNRFANPGFETGTFSGWNSGFTFGSSVVSESHSGTYSARINQGDGLYQTINTSNVASYSFFVKNLGTGNSLIRAWNDTTSVYYTINAGSGWNSIVMPLNSSGPHILEVIAWTGSSYEFDDFYAESTLNPPVANFNASPTSGNAPLPIQFTDNSTGSPTSWSWTFGDGGTSTAQNPSHTYTSVYLHG